MTKFKEQSLPHIDVQLRGFSHRMTSLANNVDDQLTDEFEHAFWHKFRVQRWYYPYIDTLLPATIPELRES